MVERVGDHSLWHLIMDPNLGSHVVLFFAAISVWLHACGQGPVKTFFMEISIFSAASGGSFVAVASVMAEYDI